MHQGNKKVAEPDFSHAFEVLEWAKSNISRLRDIEKSLLEKGAQKIVELEPETGNRIYKVALVGRLPQSTNRLASEAIMHLRHALDIACCAAWRATVGTDPPANLYFPFPNGSADLEGRLSRDPLGQLSPSTIDAIRNLSPFPPNNDGQEGSPALAALSSAAKNKHRLVCRPVGKLERASFFRGLFVGAGIDISEWDGDKYEMTYAKGSSDSFVDVSIELTISLTFTNAGPLDGTPVLHNLIVIHDICHSAVSAIQQSVQ